MEIHPICHNEILGTSGVSYLRQLFLMSNTAWNHKKGKIQLQVECFVEDLSLVIDHSLWEWIHTDICTPYTEIAKTLIVRKGVWQTLSFLNLMGGVPMFSFQSQLTVFCMQNAMCRVYFLVTNVNFSCRSALPVTQAIRMGASCFRLFGKCEAIAASSSLAVNNGLTWKLSCLLSSCLFPVLQTNSWIAGWQRGFHLQLRDHGIWKLFEGIISFWIALAL